MDHQDPVTAVAFSPDGKAVLTGSDDSTARLWDAATGRPIGIPMAHQGQVRAVAFSPDGKTVLTGSSDKTARLWDAATGRPIGTPLNHKATVFAVAFSPDGKAVLTGSSDKTARLWPVVELPDDLPRIAAWAEVVTGLALDEQGTVHALDNAAWCQARERLEREGGPPEISGRWQLDPILFGPEPTARRGPGSSDSGGRRPRRPSTRSSSRDRWTGISSWNARSFYAARFQPDKADREFLQAWALGSRDARLIEAMLRSEALFARAVTDWPDSAWGLFSKRGEDRARRKRWADAAADCGKAVRLEPEQFTITPVADPLAHGRRGTRSAPAGACRSPRPLRSDGQSASRQ